MQYVLIYIGIIIAMISSIGGAGGGYNPLQYNTTPIQTVQIAYSPNNQSQYVNVNRKTTMHVDFISQWINNTKNELNHSEKYTEIYKKLNDIVPDIIIAYIFYKLAKIEQKKSSEEMVEEVKNLLKTKLCPLYHEQDEVISIFINNVIDYFNNLELENYFLLSVNIFTNMSEESLLCVESELNLIRNRLNKSNETKYILASLFEGLSRIHFWRGNIAYAVRNSDSAASLYVEIGCKDEFYRVVDYTELYPQIFIEDTPEREQT